MTELKKFFFNVAQAFSPLPGKVPIRLFGVDALGKQTEVATQFVTENCGIVGNQFNLSSFVPPKFRKQYSVWLMLASSVQGKAGSLPAPLPVYFGQRFANCCRNRFCGCDDALKVAELLCSVLSIPEVKEIMIYARFIRNDGKLVAELLKEALESTKECNNYKDISDVFVKCVLPSVLF